jgi:hypothetical protein
MENDNLKKRIEELENKKLSKKLNDKVKETLAFVGFLLSTLGAFGYLVTIFILVFGTGNVDFQLIGKDGLFFVIGLVFGLFIRSGFYIQGITYAKQEFQPIITEYNNLKVYNTKDKRSQSFEFKMAIEILRTTGIQVTMFFVSGMGLIYLAGFEGMNNMVYLGNAFSNLLMFTGFGFLALNSSYEKYITYKIPRITEQTRVMKEERDKPKEQPQETKEHVSHLQAIRNLTQA